MNKSIVIGILASAIVLGGIVWLTSKNQETGSQTVSKGILAAKEQHFDFGTISMAKGKVKHSFTIKNEGTEAVLLKRMYTSCMCTSGLLMLNGKNYGPYGMEGMGFIPEINKTLDPGKEASVEAIFDPAAHGPAGVGNIQRAITLENNAGASLQFQFSAVVTP